MFVFFAIAFICSLVPGHQSTPVTSCADKGLAKYNVTFNALWSKEDFPKQYPLFRPHAQWTKVLGRSHSPRYTLFTVGESASPALKDFVEKGYSAEFEEETQGKQGILDIFSPPAINRGVGSSSAEVIVDAAHSQVSLASRIVPSPDWFVGISGIDLCEDGEWVEQLSIDLGPLDAGTDRGMTFSAPNWANDPQQPITEITSQEPHHPANSFYYPDRDELPPLANLNIRRVSSYSWVEGVEHEEDEWDEEPSGETEDGLPPIPQDGPVDCIVSEWNEWNPCSKTCGFGSRSRERTILRKNSRSGTPCPALSEDELCGSMRNCGWKHFQFGGSKRWAATPARSFLRRAPASPSSRTEPRSEPRSENSGRYGSWYHGNN